MKIYRIARTRQAYLVGEYIRETEEEITYQNNIFYGSWTDNPEEYENDETIDVLVAEVITLPAGLKDLLMHFNYSCSYPLSGQGGVKGGKRGNMEPYDRVIMRLLPGDTPREQFLYLQKMAKIMLKIGWCVPNERYVLNEFQLAELVHTNFTIDNLEAIAKG